MKQAELIQPVGLLKVGQKGKVARSKHGDIAYMYEEREFVLMKPDYWFYPQGCQYSLAVLKSEVHVS